MAHNRLIHLPHMMPHIFDKRSEAIEKLNKQNFNVVPNKSLADAKTWLDGEIKHWKTITTAVKIDVAQ